ncbi:helix-turn-helix domain-containing protein [Frondihabitans sp. VKM Ac-2883]|uniref:helix-turn-helix transcriptional regulator n=1 Tax=Frondihabitans sp. VKM Ac-2883 TaxID=2783823 RepID=UPI001E391C56|nr:helix-turn-helix domain-containing protein [Frondihabitans sp. VKM Ac-2883]
MSARNWAWDQPPELIGPTEQHVLNCLAEHENPEYGYAFPSEAVIALKTKLSRAAINRNTEKLEEKGLIRKVKHGRTSHGSFASLRYYLNVPESYRAKDVDWQKRSTKTLRAVV